MTLKGKKYFLVILTFLFVIQLNNLFSAQNIFEEIFREKVIKKCGDVEAYKKYLTEYYKVRIEELKGWLMETKLPERIRNDILIIIRYERLSRWVEEENLKEPALSEAKEILIMDSDKFIESSINLLEELKRVMMAMEKREFLYTLYNYLDIIVEVANMPEVLDLLISEEKEILIDIGITAHEFKKLFKEIKPIKTPPRSNDIEKLQKIYNKASAKEIQKNDKKWKRLIVGFAAVASGLGITVGDAVTLPPTAATSLVSVAAGSGIFSDGVSRLIDEFFRQ